MRDARAAPIAATRHGQRFVPGVYSPRGARLYRDLPWRRTRDPYIIWLSEVMLQQTQVPRVEARMPEWLDRFPSIEALAAASAADVLVAWQGMGYNRRALALHTAARKIVQEHAGEFPRETAAP